MSNYNKYLKYKLKYLNLKNQFGGNLDEEEVYMYYSSLKKDVCYYFIKEYKRLNVEIKVELRHIDDDRDIIPVLTGNDLNDINIEGGNFEGFDGELYVNYKGERVRLIALQMKLKHLKEPFPEFYKIMRNNLEKTIKQKKEREEKDIESNKNFEILIQNKLDDIQKGNLKKINEELYNELLKRGKIVSTDWEKKIETEEYISPNTLQYVHTGTFTYYYKLNKNYYNRICCIDCNILLQSISFTKLFKY